MYKKSTLVPICNKNSAILNEMNLKQKQSTTKFTTQNLNEEIVWQIWQYSTAPHVYLIPTTENSISEIEYFFPRAVELSHVYTRPFRKCVYIRMCYVYFFAR